MDDEQRARYIADEEARYLRELAWQGKTRLYCEKCGGMQIFSIICLRCGTDFEFKKETGKKDGTFFNIPKFISPTYVTTPFPPHVRTSLPHVAQTFTPLSRYASNTHNQRSREARRCHSNHIVIERISSRAVEVSRGR